MRLILENYKANKLVPCVNLIVENEVIYILFFKKKSAFDLKGFLHFLRGFQFLEINFEIRNLYKNFILEYNLRPNDALILATCKYYGIKYLISVDKKDFTVPCEKEGIILIDSVEKFKKILEKENL
jgi:predicted nucleic acid-binding protein